MNTIALWLERMRKSGKDLVMLRTRSAVWDIAAVCGSTDSSITIQWPKGDTKKHNLQSHQCGHDKFRVKQETLSWSAIEYIRSYVK